MVVLASSMINPLIVFLDLAFYDSPPNCGFPGPQPQQDLLLKFKDDSDWILF
jgi:hypothetical protein